MNKLLKHIVSDPKILHGKARIKGTRIPVYLILDLLATGYTHKKIIEAYPRVTEEDIKACFEYAANLAKHDETQLLGTG